jgi:hypothetical protein
MQDRLATPGSRLLGVALLAWALSTLAATSPVEPPSPDNTYLDDLQGRWIMRGTFHDKPVTYAAIGQRRLSPSRGRWQPGPKSRSASVTPSGGSFPIGNATEIRGKGPL